MLTAPANCREAPQPTHISAGPLLTCALCIPVTYFKVILIYACWKEIVIDNFVPQVFTGVGFFDECRQKCNHCTLCINTPLIHGNLLKLKENIANINIVSILICTYKHSDLIQSLNLLLPFLCACFFFSPLHYQEVMF